MPTPCMNPSFHSPLYLAPVGHRYTPTPDRLPACTTDHEHNEAALLHPADHDASTMGMSPALICTMLWSTGIAFARLSPQSIQEHSASQMSATQGSSRASRNSVSDLQECASSWQECHLPAAIIEGGVLPGVPPITVRYPLTPGPLILVTIWELAQFDPVGHSAGRRPVAAD